MAYRRYRRRRFNRRRKTPWYNKKYSAAQLAVKAVKGVSYLKGLVNSERFVHQNTATAAPDDIGYIGHLTSISQGDTQITRTGNSILARSLMLRGNITINATSSQNVVRLMIIMDKQQIGDTVPSITDILESTYSATQFYVHAPLERDSVGRFKVLKSRTYTLSDQRPNLSFSFFINMRQHIRYNGISGGDIQKNGMYLVLVSDSPNTGSAHPSVTFLSKLTYHDN